LKQEFPNISSIYFNHDYELSAIKRDNAIADWANENGISFHSYKDQVIFEKDEVVKDDQKPYTVFTPYSRKWKAKLNEFYTKSYPCEKYYSNFLHVQNNKIHSLNEIGFTENEKIAFPQNIPSIDIIKTYAEQRDFPAINGTTRLSLHLRFGTVSIRELTRLALQTSETWLNELIWRDFYMMILYQFPHVTNKSFKPQYDRIVWRNNEQEFKLWCEGKTGYPIVDAGMRELNTTGFMHNRVRMIVASFLTKHLLIDWRWGEAYFAQKLLDFDLSANNGGWQWAAGSGCDAAPYFRVFNPTLQTQKFDPKLEYIKKWVPELNSFDYPQPIVNHEFARKRCLEVYKQGLSESFQ
jgi:deoxyribodipyrimidine photo-lyase